MMRHQAKWLLVGVMCLPLWSGTTHGQSATLMDAYNRYLELRAEGRYQEALPFAKEAVRLGTQEFGPDHPTTAGLFNDLAGLYQAQSRHAEAEPLHQRSLAIREKVLGPEHPDVAQSLENYADLLRETGRGKEASQLEARARAIRAKHALDNPVE